jgi:hypothetical protein
VDQGRGVAHTASHPSARNTLKWRAVKVKENGLTKAIPQYWAILERGYRRIVTQENVADLIPILWLEENPMYGESLPYGLVSNPNKQGKEIPCTD